MVTIHYLSNYLEKLTKILKNVISGLYVYLMECICIHYTHINSLIYTYIHIFIFKLAITIDRVISINIAKKCYFIFFNTEHDLIQKLKIIKIKLYKSSPTYINFCSSFVCLINESSLGLFVSNFVHLGSISSDVVFC
jgi:hypothetical protein